MSIATFTEDFLKRGIGGELVIKTLFVCDGCYWLEVCWRWSKFRVGVGVGVQLTCRCKAKKDTACTKILITQFCRTIDDRRL